MIETKISGNSQSAHAYVRLFEAIRTGSFKPGDRIREMDIATQYGLSRTPVREAIRRLESDGIIEHKPRFGAVVRKLSRSEVVELYEMRTVLERTAAAMAAKHASQGEIDELQDLNEAMLAAGSDTPQAVQNNESFHHSIYLAARNRFLMDSLQALNNAMMLLGPTTLEGADRLSTAYGQHKSIIKALAQGNAVEAAAQAEAHINASLRYRLQSLR